MTQQVLQRPADDDELRAWARAERLYAQVARQPASVLGLDCRLREGWFSDRYFMRAAATLVRDGRDPEVTMQVFAKKPGLVAGIPEVVRMLQVAANPRYGAHSLRIQTLLDGEIANGPEVGGAGREDGRAMPWEPVMHVSGPYRAFAHLETPILGVLARRSLVASNTAAAVRAAGTKPVVFMAARHDDWRVQPGDGYAAMVGGAEAVSSDAGGGWVGAAGVGTMPHALIAAYGGDTVAATLAFCRYVRDAEPGTRVVSLVDYENDVVGTSLAVARAMRDEHGAGALHAVRVDTSESLVDRSLREDAKLAPPGDLAGVTPALVRVLRDALDREGFSDVGIVVSGGFTPDKIAAFEAAGVPVDGYGVGSSLIGHSDGRGGLMTGLDFTADIVIVNGCNEAKVGRGYAPSDRLVELDWRHIE